jgi:hypothetical protein
MRTLTWDLRKHWPVSTAMTKRRTDLPLSTSIESSDVLTWASDAAYALIFIVPDSSPPINNPTNPNLPPTNSSLCTSSLSLSLSPSPPHHQASINNILPHRLLNPTSRPIHHPHLLLPNRLIPPLHQIPHISIRTIARAALHSRIAPVPELVQVVLDSPILAPLGRVAFPDLAGEDLIGRVVAGLPDDVAFGVAELGFAHCLTALAGGWVCSCRLFYPTRIFRGKKGLTVHRDRNLLELKVPSLPASATLAVHIRLQNAFERFVISQLLLIGLVYPAVRNMTSAPL